MRRDQAIREQNDSRNNVEQAEAENGQDIPRRRGIYDDPELDEIQPATQIDGEERRRNREDARESIENEREQQISYIMNAVNRANELRERNRERTAEARENERETQRRRKLNALGAAQRRRKRLFQNQEFSTDSSFDVGYMNICLLYTSDAADD